MARDGRPTLYSDDLPEKLIEHFKQPLYIEQERQIVSGGRVKTIKELVANSMPTFERFAINNGVTHNTLRNWTKDYPDFFSAYAACKDIQKEFLMEHGLKENYSANFTKFIAVNVTDLRDKTEQTVHTESVEEYLKRIATDENPS